MRGFKVSAVNSASTVGFESLSFERTLADGGPVTEDMVLRDAPPKPDDTVGDVLVTAPPPAEVWATWSKYAAGMGYHSLEC
jgi:hypothetical protein